MQASQILEADYEGALLLLLENIDLPDTEISAIQGFGIMWMLLACQGLALDDLQKISLVPSSPNRLKEQMQLAEKDYFGSSGTHVVCKPVLSEIFAVAAAIDVGVPGSENVTVYWRSRNKGGFRLISEFGPHRRAQHIMVGEERPGFQ